MESQAAEFLLSPEGRAVVESLAGMTSGTDSLAMGQFLRKQYPCLNPAYLAAAVELRFARLRAREKFSRADEMFFTREALEQASGEGVAAHRAGRFSGLDRVCDLCCGIGGDAIALGNVCEELTCVDRDPARVAFCRENLRVYGLDSGLRRNDRNLNGQNRNDRDSTGKSQDDRDSAGKSQDDRDSAGKNLNDQDSFRPWQKNRITVIEADVFEMVEQIPSFNGVFIDPSRRIGGRRVKRLETMDPPMQVVEDILGRACGGCAKLPPGLDIREIAIGHELEWVSTGTGLKEAVLWTGSLIRAEVTVTLLHRGVSITDREVPRESPRIAGSGAYLYEPDPAMIRSGLLAGVVVSKGMWLLDENIAYTSSNDRIDDPFFTGYRILDSFPFTMKRLRSYLQDRHAGPVTIKKRGFPLEPEEVLKKLALTGDRAVIIVLTRIGNHHQVFVVEALER